MGSYYNCQECGEKIEPYAPLYMYGTDNVLCDDCKQNKESS
jgi:hypothetical protein